MGSRFTCPGCGAQAPVPWDFDGDDYILCDACEAGNPDPPGYPHARARIGDTMIITFDDVENEIEALQQQLHELRQAINPVLMLGSAFQWRPGCKCAGCDRAIEQHEPYIVSFVVQPGQQPGSMVQLSQYRHHQCSRIILPH